MAEKDSFGSFVSFATDPAASDASCSMAAATSFRCSPGVTTTTGRLTWFVGGRCVSAVLLMMELGMTTSSPLLFLMVVWRQVMSFTTPDDEPTSMLSPGLMMRSRLTCKPPMRLAMVSWKPSEMAMPPIPSAVMAALTSTP